MTLCSSQTILPDGNAVHATFERTRFRKDMCGCAGASRIISSIILLSYSCTREMRVPRTVATTTRGFGGRPRFRFVRYDHADTTTGFLRPRPPLAAHCACRSIALRLCASDNEKPGMANSALMVSVLNRLRIFYGYYFCALSAFHCCGDLGRDLFGCARGTVVNDMRISR